jgi:hypothetical protein
MHENKNFADRTTRAARETSEKGSAATQQSARGAQETFLRLPKVFATLTSD